MTVFRCISTMDAIAFLMPRHYSGRRPCVSFAFGAFVDGVLVGVCTFGKPASAPLCDGVAGREHRKRVYELNRLCREEGAAFILSQFVAFCLRELSPKNLIIVSYSDTAMHHAGYIYQACNFTYTGVSKPRTDKYTEGNKHPRHYIAGETRRKKRSAKHRYLYVCAADKRLKKQILRAINYPAQAYPKSENARYVLGDILRADIVE